MTHEREVLEALGTVRDPELDEPLTSLGFVTSCTVSADGVADVRLRLPTFFCAPNFAWLMVADAYDAVSAVPGVRQTQIELEDHFASAEINRGVAARAGFVQSFDGLAETELDELRTDFVRKAMLAATDRVCRPLLAAGRTPSTSSPYSRSATFRQSPDRRRLRRAAPSWACRRATTRRCWWMPLRGEAVGVQALPLHLRRARLTASAWRPTAECAVVCCARDTRTSGQVGDGGGPMKAVRLHEYHQQPVVEEVPEPTVKGPLDVVVKIGGAGVCRTDLHIILGQWADRANVTLPYTIGHENAGWVHEVGSAVTNVAVGDTVILHPTPTCGLCRACRAGDDMHCSESVFPGLDTDGGMAELLLTSARACVKLDPATRPEDVAALADAGITAYHAVRKAIPLLYPGTTCAVIGAGGLGHIGIQCLSALTATNIIVVDRHPDALKLAGELGAHQTVLADGNQVDAVKDLTGGQGADVVLDFVAEEGAENEGFAMTRRAGSYFVIGYGGTLVIPTLDVISTERNIVGNIVGTYNDLAELMVLAQTGKVTLHTRTYPLDDAVEALQELDRGRVRGRAILVP